jgi:nicotinate-nucleotide adenylyltransferase
MPADPDSLHFGGTFSPIHHGHLICARAAAEALGFRRVVLLPTATPPHRGDDENLLPAELRLRLARLAVEGDDFFHVDDIEHTLPPPNYTLRTVEALGGRPAWLIGADWLPGMPTWHRAEELRERVRFVTMRRPGHAIDWQALPAAWRALEADAVETPRVEISATMIRDRLRRGQSVRYLTPDAVATELSGSGVFSRASKSG